MTSSVAVSQLTLGLGRAHTPLPKPFLKWAGGKTQLLAQLACLFPREFLGYHEPFVGSAAVYWHLYGLAIDDQLSYDGRRVRLTDANQELINCYQIVRDCPSELITQLAEHRRKHGETHYYQVRAQRPENLTAIQRAARFIYLNKTCYNGLYRVNRAGQFNVPIGSYKNPRIFDPEELNSASLALQGVTIEVADFHTVTSWAQCGDFVYFDPPYVPLTQTANFTSYTEAPFGEREQHDLADIFRVLDQKGCKVMLSNSWVPSNLDLYRGFNCIEVKANRAINSNAERRGKISELIVLNYDPPV